MTIRDDSHCHPELRLLPDEALMTDLQDGNLDALAVLFIRYRRLVLSVAWHILRDRGEAEDLVQSVFMEILQSGSKFNSAKGTAKSWILQYAYHRSFNRRKYLSLRGIPHNSKPFNSAQEPPTGWCSSSFEMAESKRFVQEALARLDGKQRRILELAFYEGLSMREASERTGESFDTVRHHFYRAIDNLRSLIQNDGEVRFTKYCHEKDSLLKDATLQTTDQRIAAVKCLRTVSPRRSRPLRSSGQRTGKAILVEV
jgi:RNA polymerase sigma-70 factor (ECF subfamily)